ncbi:MAG: SAM-dependent chlorinase/fluorinase, partial [Calothrix sp. SM1_7_51]|nr:SAM-dependent chlorinase/fluorinase [Calothrix sp. SM1_7_51]
MQLVTLLSDFGERDGFVGVMKGVIAQVNEHVKVIDLTHQIPPQNIAAGRFSLINAYDYFPEGTVHVCVVDPGVGSKRRAIAVEFVGGFLVGPDNGLLSGVLSKSPAITAVELTNSEYWRTPQPSSTFHGRDIFASVGAHLASGVNIKQLGLEINPASLVKLDLPECRLTESGLSGCVQHIDYFGNLVTNILGSYVKGKNWQILAANLNIPGCETYSEVQIGDAIALVASNGWVEIAVNSGNAQLQLQINLGDVLEVEFLC